MSEDILPMDKMDGAEPPIEAPAETQEQKDQRARDEQGRFAPKPDEPKGKPDDGAAARRERAERDQYKREAEEAKAARDALQKRFDDMSAIAKGEDPEKPADDPLKPLVEKIESIDKRLQTNDEARQAEVVHKQVMQYADADEARYREQNPDFPNAVQHYITSRLQEMQALGVAQDQAEQILTKEAQQLLYQCAQSNRSPAEALHAMAKARGYQSGIVVPFQPQQPAKPAGGRSMGNGGGAAPGAVTAQQIAQMSEADYEAYRATPEGRAAIRRAMGG